MRYESLSRNLKIFGLISIVISFVIAVVVFVSAITNESAALGLIVGAGILIFGLFVGLVEMGLGASIDLLSVRHTKDEIENEK
jgi:hypothetical protein